MSLSLSGCLGRAQLGAAELGAFQTLTTGAGFLPIFPDVGPLKQAEAPKKKKAKKPKKAKRPKKPKKRKSVTIESAPAGEPKDQPDLRVRTVVERPTAEPVDPRPDTAIALALQNELYRQKRLRETIAEEDELLVMLWN